MHVHAELTHLAVLLELRQHCKSPAAAAAESLQSCPTLCDPIDGSPPGSPVPGILQLHANKNFKKKERKRVQRKQVNHSHLIDCFDPLLLPLGGTLSVRTPLTMRQLSLVACLLTLCPLVKECLQSRLGWGLMGLYS